VQSVTLFYQFDDLEMLHMQVMSEITPGVYQTNLTSDVLVGNTMKYYLVAEDAAGRQSRLPSDSSGVFSLPLWIPRQNLLLVAVGIILSIVVVVIVVKYRKRLTR
jgi:hypothetical protein